MDSHTTTFVADLDDACSRFRDDSGLARLNAAGAAVVRPLALEAELAGSPS